MKKFFLILISVFVIFFLAKRIPEEWQRHRLLTSEVENLEMKKQGLLEEEERLAQVLETGTQEEILEREARLMLGYKKEGEQVVLVIPSTNNTEEIATTSEEGLSASIRLGDNVISKFSQFWHNLIEKIKK
ncbi:MAG: septum formation initiator family protein [Candidatus Pacebacteria bacterium]|nr:septum formation initiator family protein [Candidatus Paceibacterota bacterium]MDD5721642.1 septum formation initiator family protein [Candidatus Paceibacterota bacterium]